MKKQILIYSFSLFAFCTLQTGRAGAYCGQPVQVAIRTIDNTSATIEWTAIIGSDGYNMRYRKAGSGNWLTVSSQSESLDLSGLGPNQNYEFQVQSICNGSPGAFTEPRKFTTLIYPNIPPVLSTPSSVTGTGATISWPIVPGACSYQVQWKTVNSSTWTSVNGITSTSFSSRNLASCTGYQFRVRTVCTNYSSVYSNVVTCTTNCPTSGTTQVSSRIGQSENTSSAVVSLYPNPVLDFLTIEYRSANTGTINTNVYNMIGKVVMNWTADVQEGPNELKFNASQLAAGIYFFEIENKGEITRSKFMVAN